MQPKVGYVRQSILKANGILDDAVRFVVEKQLKDRVQWGKYNEVYTTREDTWDEIWAGVPAGKQYRWRGEYFGKQMRGAVLVYQYTKDEELYDILTATVLDLLPRQDEFGRFSTYPVEDEYNGWDIWCRKYILVGMLYYRSICKDEALKERILTACQKHLDYVVATIGDKEGQKSITKTSEWWGCVNSCTILEPTVEMYKLTGKESYLDFAKYIIAQGGSSDCNLIELALNEELYPYQYPVTKAYEMMSFYEGLLAYYEVTGEEKYFEVVAKFMDAVAKSDITIIGCAGCTHELFDNSAKMQTEYHENIMQETCVTVTWMRVLRRLYDLTGDAKYINRFEISAYNALYGSLNTEMNKQWNMLEKRYYEPGAFDSYSPLYMNTRGRGIGGQMCFASGGYGGCCLAIGACGIALVPLTAVMQGEEGVYLNLLFDGNAKVKAKDGKEVSLRLEGNYFTDGKIKVTVEDACSLTLKIRKPEWCEEMSVNGVSVTAEGYYTLDKQFAAGEEVVIALALTLKAHYLNDKVAFTYGALTLAVDEHKASRDLKAPVCVGETLSYKLLPTEEGELVRMECELANGEKLLLADYQSCGKKWLSDKPMMTVWFNTVEGQK